MAAMAVLQLPLCLRVPDRAQGLMWPATGCVARLLFVTANFGFVYAQSVSLAILLQVSGKWIMMSEVQPARLLGPLQAA